MRKPIATWSSARDAWETNQTSICGHSGVYSETWPISGTTRSGKAYALPTSARLMGASESSSLLPTPQTVDQSDWSAGSVRRAQGHQVMLASEIKDLLPTVRVSDTNGPSRHGTGGPDLRTVIDEELLPTPTAESYGNNQSLGPNAAVRPSLEYLTPDLLPTPMASVTNRSESPESRKARGHGSYFDDLPHLLGLIENQDAPKLPTPRATRGGSSTETAERLRLKPNTSRRKRRESTLDGMPSLFDVGN